MKTCLFSESLNEPIIPALAFKLTIKPKIIGLLDLFPEAEIYPTGSRYICNPPVMTTDVDFIMYVPDKILKVVTRLNTEKFKISSLEYEAHSKWDFVCYRKGRTNIILNSSAEFTQRHVVATHICKLWNVYHKRDRVLIHEIVRGEFDHRTVEWKTNSFYPEDRKLLMNLGGPHGKALCLAYMLQHEITGFKYEPQTAS